MCMLIGLATSNEATTPVASSSSTTRRHHERSELSHSIGNYRLGGDGGGESYHTSVNRILRSNDASFRSQDVRWKQVVSRDAMERRRLFKRSVAQPSLTTLDGIKVEHLAVNGITTLDVPTNVIDDRLDANQDPVSTTTARHIATQSPNQVAPNRTLVKPRKSIKRWMKSKSNMQSERGFIDLSCQEIDRLPTDILPENTTQLDVSCNQLATTEDLVATITPNLTALDLSHNHLQRIGAQLFRNAANLVHLNLTDNRLQAIARSDFDQLRRLESLRLAGNGLVHVAPDTFADLVNLQLLDLSYNAIDASAVRALQGIPALRALSVAFNADLGRALQEFVASWSLKELDASGTGLCAIPAALAQSVHTLNVSHNHFEVGFDCSISFTIHTSILIIKTILSFYFLTLTHLAL